MNILLGRLFWDYLDKIEANCGVEEEDESAHINKNILMENKQITKTLSEILKNGDLLPHVSKSSITCQIIKDKLLTCRPWWLTCSDLL